MQRVDPPRPQSPGTQPAPGDCLNNCAVFFFFFTLVTGSKRSVSFKLGDTRVYAPKTRALYSERKWLYSKGAVQGAGVEVWGDGCSVYDLGVRV